MTPTVNIETFVVVLAVALAATALAACGAGGGRHGHGTTMVNDVKVHEPEALSEATAAAQTDIDHLSAGVRELL